jgi:hypothetical protein
VEKSRSIDARCDKEECFKFEPLLTFNNEPYFSQSRTLAPVGVRSQNPV